MAEGSRHSVYFVEESISGVTPNNPQLSVFRATGSSLDISIKTLESDEIRDDAETADFRLGARHVEGTLNAELSFGTFDELMAAVLRTRWVNDVAKGSVDRRTFTFITKQADLPDGQYTIYRGCEINLMTLTVSAETMTVSEFGVVGRTMEISNNLPFGATIKDRTTAAPMDGFAGALREAGIVNSVITELSLTIENGIEPRFVVGSKFSIEPSAKRRDVKGSINTYFEDNKLREKFLDEVSTDLEFELINPDNANEKYIFTLPKVKFTEAPVPVDGEGDVMLNLGFKGLWEPTLGSSIQIERFIETI